MNPETKNNTKTHERTKMLYKEAKEEDKSIELNSSFLFHNGVKDEVVVDNIEMIRIQAVTYTSLKDIIPSTFPNSMSPSNQPHYNALGSWYECQIPIKNPLVKHAALAYLHPMSSTLLDVGDRGFFFNFMDNYCSACAECGCLSWLFHFVLKGLRGLFSIRSCGEEEEEENVGDKVD